EIKALLESGMPYSESMAERRASPGFACGREPLYAKAREPFIAAGDERNALYAEVSQLPGRLPTLPVPDASERLSEYLDNPIVRSDERLRLRVLVIKREPDEDLAPSLSQR